MGCALPGVAANSAMHVVQVGLELFSLALLAGGNVVGLAGAAGVVRTGGIALGDEVLDGASSACT